MAKQREKSHQKEGKAEDFFRIDHDLDLREYIRFKRLYRRGDRPLSLDTREYFKKLDMIRDECKTFGIEGKLIMDALDGVYDASFNQQGIDHACEELSLQLLENIVLRMDLESSGETHLVGRGRVVPDSLINEVALLMLESCGENDVSPSNALSILFRVQLNRIEPPSFMPKDGKAKDLAVLLYAADRTLSTRDVAQAVGVHHTTVSRWKQEKNFQEKIDNSGKIFITRRMLDKFIQRARQTRNKEKSPG